MPTLPLPVTEFLRPTGPATLESVPGAEDVREDGNKGRELSTWVQVRTTEENTVLSVSVLHIVGRVKVRGWSDYP